MESDAYESRHTKWSKDGEADANGNEMRKVHLGVMQITENLHQAAGPDSTMWR
jgi:hypothetical protein